jgi:protein-tyrosine-phosphatase
MGRFALGGQPGAGRTHVQIQRAISVLFVCADNASGSILAESILRSLGGTRFKAYSAAIRPAAALSPALIEFLQARRLPTEGLRPARLQEFSKSRLDFVITVSPGVECLLPEEWPGEPVIAHWRVEEDALWDAFWVLSRRIKLFTSLPHGTAPRRALERRVQEMPAWQ